MDITGFEDMFGEYYPKALSFVRKKVSNPQTAEDITMEAFFVCFKNMERFNPEKASFSTWLYVILNNKIKNYYRDVKTSDELSDETTDGESFENEILEAEYISQMREHLRQALLSLNEIQREIIICKYFQNMNAKEIAQKLGLTHGNVRIQLMRGLGHMRDYFDKNNISFM